MQSVEIRTVNQQDEIEFVTIEVGKVYSFAFGPVIHNNVCINAGTRITKIINQSIAKGTSVITGEEIEIYLGTIRWVKEIPDE